MMFEYLPCHFEKALGVEGRRLEVDPKNQTDFLGERITRGKYLINQIAKRI
jgi:hypothetical protein